MGESGKMMSLRIFRSVRYVLDRPAFANKTPGIRRRNHFCRHTGRRCISGNVLYDNGISTYSRIAAYANMFDNTYRGPHVHIVSNIGRTALITTDCRKLAQVYIISDHGRRIHDRTESMPDVQSVTNQRLRINLQAIPIRQSPTIEFGHRIKPPFPISGHPKPKAETLARVPQAVCPNSPQRALLAGIAIIIAANQYCTIAITTWNGNADIIASQRNLYIFHVFCF